MFPLLLLLLFLQTFSSAFCPVPTTKTRRDCSLAAYSVTSRTAPAIQSTREKPIVVIGAAGKTGRIITQILAEQGQHVRAVTRTEKYLTNLKPSSLEYLSYGVADVTDYDAVLSVLKQGASGVIWAATSSGKKGGGDAVEVDYKGAYHVAKACLACNVPKLAFLSAACVTHPNAPGSKAVNMLTQFTYGDTPWIDAKIAGETAVRDLYAANKKQKNSSYVVVRGGAPLVNKPPVPVEELMVLQGDLYSSGVSISRTNVARMVVSALLRGKATDGTTFEVCPATRLYKNEEANFLDLVGLPSLHQTKDPDLPRELIHRNAHSYEGLLDGLKTDDEMQKEYGSIVTGYRGDSVHAVDDFNAGNPALQS